MSLIYAVESWNFLHWILLICMILFAYFWITGSSKLNNVEDRLFRMELFDPYYEMTGGFMILQLRNVVVFGLLFLIFKLI